MEMQVQKRARLAQLAAPAALVGLMALQGFLSVYFLMDGIEEVTSDPGSLHSRIEFPAALCMALGTVLTALTVRNTLKRLREQDDALAKARRAMRDAIAQQFLQWGLSRAEQDVGLLALRGLDVAEIAEARGAAQGTVRAQLSRIYLKAGVAGRPQFAAFFVEGLLAEDTAP
jgi:DNA-binding CsgD family transcriptional regulator